MEEGRFLGLDYGEKRIGVAVSDPLRLSAQPLAYVPNSATCAQDISELCDRWDVVELVIGLPKKLDGSESFAAEKVRTFAEHLREVCGRPVVMRDERLSTVAVTRMLIDADLSRKRRKEVVDSQAAAFVLQGYLDFLRRTQPSAGN
ncbi:Holliday junction resolvase RuvX [bacterium]|nr:Holliday junction resolvase RuvX [bacterium]